jgi:hypothetical protein
VNRISLVKGSMLGPSTNELLSFELNLLQTGGGSIEGILWLLHSKVKKIQIINFAT